MSPPLRSTDPSPDSASRRVLMRMRLLLTVGLAALVSTAGASAALGPMRLREQPQPHPQSTFVAPPRPLPHFRMRWAHAPRLRGLAAARERFPGGRGVVGLENPKD